MTANVSTVRRSNDAPHPHRVNGTVTHESGALDLSLSPRSSKESGHELPQLLPLSHNHPLLSPNHPFDVDSFLLSRSHLSLQDLRSELRTYLAELKEELVQLINDDYAAFISLSTDLKGEGARLERLQRPLASLKGEIEKSRSELAEVQDTVKAKLGERSQMREEKALLHLLLKLSDSVSRLESLLLISSADQTSQSVDFSGLGIRGMDGLSVTVGDEDGKEDRSRGGQAKHLARVAAEYTQLLYHAEKAREDKCVFVEELQWRIDRIKTTLCRDLDHLFSNTLTSLTSSSVEAATITDKARWTADLTECLRTYDVLRNWRDAEEVVRRDLVRPFVKNTIFSGALSVAPAPILVRTPLPGKTSLLSPRTPFTPFPGTRINPFDLAAVDALPLLHEEDNDPLAGLYNTILRFVQVNCAGVVEVSERISSRARKGPLKPMPDIASLRKESEIDFGLNLPGFEITANVVWAEIGRAIMEELGSVVFSAGNPDEFQKNYTTTSDFISSLEHLAPSLHAVETMRDHPTYAAFQRRWQLPVYFQLRWKEIVGELENVLAQPPAPRQSMSLDDFISPQASAFFTAIQTCWSSTVYIPELGHRFWRLTLQLLSRYKQWLDSIIPKDSATTSAPAADKYTTTGPSLVPRSGTPAPPIGESVETTAADEVALQRAANAYIDISAMKRRVWDLWTTQIAILLPQDSMDEPAKTPEDVLKLALESLAGLLPDCASQITVILIRQCSESLSLVRSIPSQYRASNKRRDPTGPSYFVPNILAPIRRFFAQEGITKYTSEDDRKLWATEVFDTIAVKYTSYLDAMKKTEDSLRRYKKGKISAFSLFGAGGSKEADEGKDEDRIRAQILLDVTALGEDAKRLGVAVDDNQSYTALHAAASSPAE